MTRQAKQSRTIVFNLDSTFEYVNASGEAKMRKVIHEFIEAVNKHLDLPADQELCLFLSPATLLSSRSYRPFQNPLPRRSYREDIVRGVLWVSYEGYTATHFPYSIAFSETGVSFDAGPEESAEEAAKIVRDEIRQVNRFDMSMAPPMDLVSRYIVDLLPRATAVAL